MGCDSYPMRQDDLGVVWVKWRDDGDEGCLCTLAHRVDEHIGKLDADDVRLLAQLGAAMLIGSQSRIPLAAEDRQSH